MLSCPRCDSRLLYRSRHWRLADFLLLFLGMRPLRCGECWLRFHVAFWRRPSRKALEEDRQLRRAVAPPRRRAS